PTASALNARPSVRSARWKKMSRPPVRRMKPWLCPITSFTIRPAATTPRRSGGRFTADSSGTALPARLRSAAGRAVAAESAAARRLGPRLVDGEIAAADLGRIQFANGFLRFLVGAHLDKRKPPRATRRLVADNVHRLDRAGAREELLELVFTGFIGQVSNVQLSAHTRSCHC